MQSFLIWHNFCKKELYQYDKPILGHRLEVKESICKILNEEDGKKKFGF